MVTVEEFESVPTAQSPNFQPLLRFFRRKSWLIAGVTGIVTGLGIWYTIANRVPTYQGAFQLLVEPVSQEAELSDPSTITGTARRTRGTGLDYSTQLRILQSPKMIEQILAELQTQYPTLTKDQLIANLAIGRVGGSSRFDQSKIVEVRYQASDPQIIIDVLSVTADEYLEYSLEERKTNLGEGVNFIDEQLPKLRQDVDTLSAQIQALRQQYNFLSPEVQASGIYEETRQLATQQMELQRQLQELRTRYISLRNQLNVTPEQAADELLLRGDPAYQELLGQIKQLNIELASESSRFQAGSPTIQFLQEKQQNLQRLLAQETQRILGTNLTSQRLQSIVENQQSESRTALLQQYINISNEFEALQSRNQLLTQDRAVFEQQIQQFPAIERQYRELARQLEIATTTLDEFSIKKQLLQVEVAQEQFPWEIIAEPELRKQPSGDLVTINPSSLPTTVAKFGLVGLALGVGIAFVIEKVQNKFYNHEDIQEGLNFPLFGTVPTYEPPKSQKLKSQDNVAGLLLEEESQQEHLPFIKSIEALYTNLRLATSERSNRSLAVCSAEPQEGKSTIALHIAQIAASSGQKVLLVDANLVHPQLHEAFNLPNHQGLSELLVNPDSSFQGFIQEIPRSKNLHVLTAGNILSTRLLASEQLFSVMESLSSQFDLVVYDTPYLVDHPNTNLLAAHTDGVAFVLSPRRNKRSVVKSVLQESQKFQIPILGVIVNQTPKQKQTSLDIRNFEQFSAIDEGSIREISSTEEPEVYPRTMTESN